MYCSVGRFNTDDYDNIRRIKEIGLEKKSRAGSTCPVYFVSKNALQSTKNTSKVLNINPISTLCPRGIFVHTKGNFVERNFHRYRIKKLVEKKYVRGSHKNISRNKKFAEVTVTCQTFN